MNNNRYIKSFGLSGLFALIGFGICMLNFDITADTPEGCVLWTAELFAVCLTMGLIGMEAELFLRKKRFVALGRKNPAVSLISAVLIGCVIGAAGQAVFGLDIESQKVKSDEKIKTKETNVVLLMDYSGSMDYYIADETEVTCQLIDGLDKNVSMQIVAFSDTVEPRAVSDFLPLTDANKDNLKDFVRNIDIWHGGTNFDLPLEVAFNTLSDNEKKDCRSVVLMLSDYAPGGYTFTNQKGQQIKDEGFEVYSVRITYQGGENIDPNDQFAQFVDKDIPIVKAADGSIDTEELLGALTESVKGTREKTKTKNKLILGEELLTAQSDAALWKIIIRAVFFSLFSMAAGYVYYGFEDTKKLLINAAPGLLAAVISLINPVLAFVVLLLVGLGSFTRFEITEERHNV